MIIGSRQLQLALDDLNDSKPTIVLSHYAITSLDPEERRMVSNMLDDYHIYIYGWQGTSIIMILNHVDIFILFSVGNLKLKIDVSLHFW